MVLAEVMSLVALIYLRVIAHARIAVALTRVLTKGLIFWCDVPMSYSGGWYCHHIASCCSAHQKLHVIRVAADTRATRILLGA